MRNRPDSRDESPAIETRVTLESPPEDLTGSRSCSNQEVLTHQPGLTPGRGLFAGC